jgi:hypothetical protein
LLVTALTVLGVELSFSPETYTIGSPYNFTWSRNASDPETFHLFCGVDGQTYPQGTIDTGGKLSGPVTLDLSFPPIKYVMSQGAVARVHLWLTSYIPVQNVIIFDGKCWTIRTL